MHRLLRGRGVGVGELIAEITTLDTVGQLTKPNYLVFVNCPTHPRWRENVISTHIFSGFLEAWVDDDGEMLCYVHANTLHKYDTRARSLPNPNHGRWLHWDKQLRLPVIPSIWISSNCRWSIHGGYCTTMFSPLIFELPPSQNVYYTAPSKN